MGDIVDGNLRAEEYCDMFGISSVQPTGGDGNMNMKAGMECCAEAIEVAGTIV